MFVKTAVVILMMLVSFRGLDAQDVPLNTPSCFAVELSEWQPPLQPGNEPFQTPPARFVLHDSIGTSVFERGKRLVRPVIPRGRTPSAFWEPIGSDSIRVVWTNGFAGVTMRLENTSEGLRGTASAFTDVRIEGQQNPTATASARPIKCDTLIGPEPKV